ncbi:MAG: hypothetical protein PVJ80_05045 [Gemmatimonadota bacterium]|jgi:hypothetical protein
MDPIASLAERTLLKSAHPALKLSELLAFVSERLDRSLDARRLRAILERHPDHFRVLEPWRGRWALPAREAVSGESVSGDRPDEPWVVAIGHPDDPPDGPTPVALNLRESVRWLARGVDPRSNREVSRWYAIALSERAVRSTLARRAA